MTLPNESSLGSTLDAIAEALFFNRSISELERTATIEWITSRHALDGAYGNLFAPTQSDVDSGFTLFTGRRIKNSAAFRHVLGEEACRALILLKPKTKRSLEILGQATSWMSETLINWQNKAWDSKHYKSKSKGEFCCSTCTPAVWRLMTAGGLTAIDHDLWITEGMKNLKQRRTPNGEWRTYDFYYTVLALSEMEHPMVSIEIQHALPKLQKIAAQNTRENPYEERRRILAQRILEKH